MYNLRNGLRNELESYDVLFDRLPFLEGSVQGFRSLCDLEQKRRTVWMFTPTDLLRLGKLLIALITDLHSAKIKQNRVYWSLSSIWDMSLPINMTSSSYIVQSKFYC